MNNYISIRQVLDDILVHPLLQDVTLERAVAYTIEFLRIVGCPKIFEEKVTNIEVKDYRAKLPCDFYKIIQVKKCTTDNSNIEVFRGATDNFHMENSGTNDSDLTYKIQGGVIITSIESGVLTIAYQAIVVDSEGYPMIPDDSSLIRALELYIKKKYFGILVDMGKINPQVYQITLQDYAWAVGQAQTSLIMPTLDEMQSITNSWNTLLSRVNEHSKGFKTNGSKENFKLH